jgi:hypothetical protein
MTCYVGLLEPPIFSYLAGHGGERKFLCIYISRKQLKVV